MRATSNADERGHVSIEINCAPKIERTERTLQQYARATHQASLKQDFQLYETCISSYKLFLLGQDAESVSARVFGMKTLQEGTQLIQRMRQRLEGGNIKLRATLGNNFERGTVSKVQILQKHDKFMQSMKNFVDRIGSTAAVQRRLQALKQSLVEASTASHQTGRSNTDGATKRYLSMEVQTKTGQRYSSTGCQPSPKNARTLITQHFSFAQELGFPLPSFTWQTYSYQTQLENMAKRLTVRFLEQVLLKESDTLRNAHERLKDQIALKREAEFAFDESSKKCERLNNILAERQLEYNHERQRIDDAIRLLTLELDKFENTMPVDVQYTTSQELTTVKAALTHSEATISHERYQVQQLVLLVLEALTGHKQDLQMSFEHLVVME